MQMKKTIKFLKNYLRELQKTYRVLSETIYPQDFVLIESDELPFTDEKAERIARLADKYRFDGSLYRNLIPDLHYNPTAPESMRQLSKQINTIPKIIAKIEKAIRVKKKKIKFPKDLIDLAKALTQVQISRTQIKRDIAAGKIKSYRKNRTGKHFVSLSEIRNLYLTK